MSYCLLKATTTSTSWHLQSVAPIRLHIFFAEVRGALKDVTLCCPVTEKKGMLSFPPLLPVFIAHMSTYLYS